MHRSLCGVLLPTVCMSLYLFVCLSACLLRHPLVSFSLYHLSAEWTTDWLVDFLFKYLPLPGCWLNEVDAVVELLVFVVVAASVACNCCNIMPALLLFSLLFVLFLNNIIIIIILVSKTNSPSHNRVNQARVANWFSLQNNKNNNAGFFLLLRCYLPVTIPSLSHKEHNKRCHQYHLHSHRHTLTYIMPYPAYVCVCVRLFIH